LPQANSRYSN